jgi:hypothetical protein
MTPPQQSEDSRASSSPSSSRAASPLNEDDDIDVAEIAAFPRRQSRDSSSGSGAVEEVPLLPRWSISHIKGTHNAGSALLAGGRGPSYGSEDEERDADEPEGGEVVRVQSGVKKVEAITTLWTQKSLIIAYVRYLLD